MDVDDADAFEDAFGEASGHPIEEVPIDAFYSGNLSWLTSIPMKECNHLKDATVCNILIRHT